MESLRSRAKVPRQNHQDEHWSPKTVATSAPSSSNALDAGTRSNMEGRFGFDFANVSIHADSDAAELTRDLGANAVTIGSDVYFGAGKFAPQTSGGSRLLAHELTHVVQNERAPSASSFSALSERGSSSEVEAHSAADRVVAGHNVAPSAAPTAALSMDPEDGSHHKAGLLDHIFGLNPEKSFVESGMDGLGYGPDGIWGRPTAEGEGQGTTAARALGAAAVSPLALFAAIGGHGLDEVNHGPSIFHGAFDW